MSKPPKKRTDLAIREIVVKSESVNKLSVKTNISHGLKIAETNALIDCGAEGRFVDESVVDMRQAKKLRRPLKCKNVDRSENKKGTITHQVMISYSIRGIEMKDLFYITDLGDQKIILGIPWLKHFNPQIDWRNMSFALSETPPSNLHHVNPEEELIIQFIEGIWI